MCRLVRMTHTFLVQVKSTTVSKNMLHQTLGPLKIVSFTTTPPKLAHHHNPLVLLYQCFAFIQMNSVAFNLFLCFLRSTNYLSEDECLLCNTIPSSMNYLLQLIQI